MPFEFDQACGLKPFLEFMKQDCTKSVSIFTLVWEIIQEMYSIASNESEVESEQESEWWGMESKSTINTRLWNDIIRSVCCK